MRIWFALALALVWGCGGDDVAIIDSDAGPETGVADVITVVDTGTDAGPLPDASPTLFAVGGTVSGLSTADAGAGLVLQNNNLDSLTVKANGAFAFATKLPTGASYSVTVKTQPAGLTCSVSAGSGTVGAADVSKVVVNCSNVARVVGGTLTGLATGATVTLQNNAANDLVLSANGKFAFSAPVALGSAYVVSVKTQPALPAQTCTVTNGGGTIGAAEVTNVTVTCVTKTFTVGGTVTGLSTGNSLVAQNNGGSNLTISANGTYSFVGVASGSAYAVTVLTQPGSPAQTCTVANGTGKVGSANVTNANITCATKTFTVGGTLTGLTFGNGVILRNNGGDDKSLAVNGAFTFTTPVASGSTYAVTVQTQPNAPVQNCTVSGGTGTVGSNNVTSVVVNCANTFTVGGTISGLGAGTVVLQNNGGDNLPLTANGSFAFPTPLVGGATYAVTISSQPSNPTQICTLTNASGTVGTANVTTVGVTCITSSYKVGGTVTGLAAGEQVQLHNGVDTIPVVANGNFVFPTSVKSGAAYTATVTTNPTGTVTQTCTVTNGSGLVGAADVTNIAVLCAANTYKVGGLLTGLASGATLVLQDNGTNNLTLTQNGTFEFATQVASGQTYTVSVLSQPGTPSQACTLTSSSGTITNADVTTVSVTCTTNSFTVSGNVVGLSGTGLVLANNGGDAKAIAGNGPFVFTTPVLSGTNYDVTVQSQPSGPTQTCNVSGGSGKMGGSNVVGVVVNCATNSFVIGGTITGLGSGDTVVLLNNGGDNLSVKADGTFAFATPVLSSATYAVTVGTNPTSPISQTCAVTANGTGTVTNANVTDVTVACTTNAFKVGGVVTGLASGDTLTLTNNGADAKTITANGDFFFDTVMASGLTYSVASSQPGAPIEQSCVVTQGTGTVGNGNVTSVLVTCTTTPYAVTVNVNGLVTTTAVSMTLQNNGGSNLTVSANGTASFTTTVSNGSPYSVAITSQPSNTISQSQICNVVNGSGTMPIGNQTVQVYCGRTCLSIHQAFPIGSGSFLVDPDGSGPIVEINAYCDMAFDGGGWTLAQATASGLGPDQCTQGPVAQGSCSYLPTNIVEALANLSSQVHVRVPAATPSVYVTSTSTATPIIANLRAGNVLNQGIATGDTTLQRSFWTKAGMTAEILDFNCAPNATWPSVYHACGNGGGTAEAPNGGWHLLGVHSRFEWQGGNTGANLSLETYAR